MSEQGAILSAEELAEIESSTFFEREAPWELVDGEHTGPLGKQIAALLVSHAALAAQLATAQATIAEVERDAKVSIARVKSDWRDQVELKEERGRQLAQERERRIASEGREGELISLIRSVRVDGLYAHEDYLSSCDCPICTITRRLDVALATPASDRAGGADGK